MSNGKKLAYMLAGCIIGWLCATLMQAVVR